MSTFTVYVKYIFTECDQCAVLAVTIEPTHYKPHPTALALQLHYNQSTCTDALVGIASNINDKCWSLPTHACISSTTATVTTSCLGHHSVKVCSCRQAE